MLTLPTLQVDVFKIIAVHLGTLNQVLVGFKSLKKGTIFERKTAMCVPDNIIMDTGGLLYRSEITHTHTHTRLLSKRVIWVY